MEKVLLILLGGLSAVLGGFFHQRYQNSLKEKGEDRELLLKALEILIDMQPELDDLVL